MPVMLVRDTFPQGKVWFQLQIDSKGLGGVRPGAAFTNTTAILANPPDFRGSLPILIALTRFPPGVTILPYFSRFLTKCQFFPFSQPVSGTVQRV